MFPADSTSMLTVIMLEFVGTILFLAIVGAIALYRQLSKCKVLKGQTVLITNGENILSQSLANELSSVHECRVILLKNSTESTTNNNYESTKNRDRIETMYCNVSSIAELNKFRKQIENNLNGIDVLIDNGLTDRIDLQNEANDCRRVITILGDRVRTTINLLMFIVPKMKCSSNGHIVSIQSKGTHSNPLVDTRRDVQELIRHLLDGNETDENRRNAIDIPLTAIVCDGKILPNQMKYTTKRILTAIQRQCSLVCVGRENTWSDLLIRPFMAKQ